MCLGVPMKITAIEDGAHAAAEIGGVTYRVDLSLLDNAVVGEFVIVHAGFAIEKLDQDEALLRLSLFEALAKSSEPQE